MYREGLAESFPEQKFNSYPTRPKSAESSAVLAEPGQNKPKSKNGQDLTVGQAGGQRSKKLVNLRSTGSMPTLELSLLRSGAGVGVPRSRISCKSDSRAPGNVWGTILVGRPPTFTDQLGYSSGMTRVLEPTFLGCSHGHGAAKQLQAEAGFNGGWIFHRVQRQSHSGMMGDMGSSWPGTGRLAARITPHGYRSGFPDRGNDQNGDIYIYLPEPEGLR
ncbi:hypothetical protein B0H17DRAFT_1129957 [Mycena rosella]|uniref:Uncharacterized protein n=1 Tax=Mycena rosella TaxID=1033263 RepID=A0AAD7DRF3_MYCRO|nr:hypothetical protein B0H17DRAFT_1129957 [Mycena rosella]